MQRSANRGVKLSSVALVVAVLAISAWFNQASAQSVDSCVDTIQTK